MAERSLGSIPSTLVVFDTGSDTVQSVSAGNPLPVDATLVGDVTIGNIAKANAADPSLAEDGSYPVSVDLSGHQRVIDDAVVAAIVANTSHPVATTETTGTITVGGTAQTAVAAKADRAFLIIYNDDSLEVLRYRFGGAASAASCGIPPGGTALFDRACPTGLVSLVAATTNHKFAIQEG